MTSLESVAAKAWAALGAFLWISARTSLASIAALLALDLLGLWTVRVEQIAQGLVARGVRRLVVAGGETAGAAVKALGITGLRIGGQIDPGVPWTVSLPASPGEPPLALALKSGNFGAPDFFLRAFAVLDGEAR